MDLNVILKFTVNNFLFSFSIILISFILSWVLYKYVILRKISLMDALFAKDNPAAWVEFIGAFIFPALYLSAKAIEGSASPNIYVDLGISAVYAVVFVIILTLLRLFSGVIVKLMGASDQNGGINLNNEIYNQKNISAALFSAVLSMIFASMIMFVDILPQYFVISFLKVSTILVFTLAAVIGYSLVLRRRTTLFKEIFIDNNPAAGVSLLGFVFAVETILRNAITIQTAFDYFELLTLAGISLLLFGVLSVIFYQIFTRVIKIDFMKEVYEQNNVGAALGQAALYVGVAYVIIHFMS